MKYEVFNWPGLIITLICALTVAAFPIICGIEMAQEFVRLNFRKEFGGQYQVSDWPGLIITLICALTVAAFPIICGINMAHEFVRLR